MSTATDMLDLYIAAEKAVLSGKSYTIAGRALTRENLSEIREGRQEWERRVANEQARTSGGSSTYSVADWT